MNQRALTLAAATLLSLCPLAASAQAPPPASPPAAGASGGEANRHFLRGVELYNESDFNAALIEFRRAYELDPRYQALYNIGETQFQLQDYANALKTLEKYLRDGGAQVSAERRDGVQKEIDKLRTRVATLDVTTSVPGAEITVDDVAFGKTPLSAPLTVSAGRRRLTATLPGRAPLTQIIEVAGGDAKKLALTMPDQAGDDGARARPVPAAPWVVTGVLAAGAVITGVLALSASSSLKDALHKVPGNQADIDGAHGKAFALGITTDVLTGAAVVMAGVSIYFTASALSSKKTERPTARLTWIGAGAPPAAAMRLQAGPRGVALTGSF